jgi:hypothetical protein
MKHFSPCQKQSHNLVVSFSYQRSWHSKWSAGSFTKKKLQECTDNLSDLRKYLNQVQLFPQNFSSDYSPKIAVATGTEN